MVSNDLLSLVNTRPLKFWKETLALCSDSTSPQVPHSVSGVQYPDSYQQPFDPRYGIGYNAPAPHQQPQQPNLFVPSPATHSGSLSSPGMDASTTFEENAL
ncbi:uncharacterized protein LOC123920188 isoform X1 [Trifolium pratense]|uniref:uncharacterized protein LOC123920188 isoform X1 n=1 Tax=Trifolium pratense TaxID=57577 RepID=UPI001E694F97|nr:uncharacterized protein LOC123920188 isoform X1 [Trifolium pratense]